jgi:hypothetical protein
MLNRDVQLAMSPTPIITDAPLNATTSADDAAGGGVRLIAGLHAPAVNTAVSVDAYEASRMVILGGWNMKPLIATRPRAARP